MSSIVTLPRCLSEPLGGSPLSLAMQSGKLAGLEHPWPGSVEEWRRATAAVRGRFNGDDWLRRLAPALGDSTAIPALTRAAKTGVVVTTGQQAGLFGGPLLT